MATEAMRDRILDLVRSYPGLHLREIARQLDTSVALVEYHVPFLLEDGSIECLNEDRHHRLYPPYPGLPHEAIAALRDERRLHIVLKLFAESLSHGELVAATHMGKSTLSFHLRRLEDVGLIEKTADGKFALIQPERLRDLLDNHQPTPNMLQRFAGLWDDLYGN